MAGKTKSLLQIPLRGMDLETTLFCGQSFSWQKLEQGRFAGVAGPYAVHAWEDGEWLLLSCADGEPMGDEEEAFWKRYFACDVDYEALQARFAKSKALARCVAAAPGIRVLRQPFFDTLLSFIISQNNHIPRIMGIVQRLCEGFGPQLAPGLHGFPLPQALAGLQAEDLAPLRAGFRAKYLLDAARKVNEGTVQEARLQNASDAEARQMLMQITGVGPKVADCVLLFALGRTAVVPMDVWMKRATQQVFPKGLPRCAKGSEGIAQQYVFHWARENLLKKEV